MSLEIYGPRFNTTVNLDQLLFPLYTANYFLIFCILVSALAIQRLSHTRFNF